MTARLDADWPAPAGVHAFTTLRHGAGRSPTPFDSFNLGNGRARDGDDPAVVARNRVELVERFALPSPPRWLRQVHGSTVARLDSSVVAGAGGRCGGDLHRRRRARDPDRRLPAGGVRGR